MDALPESDDRREQFVALFVRHEAAIHSFVLTLLPDLNDRTARMWRVKDGRQLLVIEAGHSPQGIAWSEKHQLLVTADGTVKLWKCSFDVNGASIQHDEH